MAENSKRVKTPLPDGGCDHVRSAILGVISLAQYVMAATRGWAVNIPIARLRLKAENDRLRQHVAFLTEEIRIKDARMGRIAPHKRPQYAPAERMAILELRAALGHSTCREYSRSAAQRSLARHTTAGMRPSKIMRAECSRVMLAGTVSENSPEDGTHGRSD